MLITLNQLKASLVAFKNWVLARIPSKTSDLTNDSNFITTADIPISSDTTLGLAKPVQEYGTISDRNGGIAINSATSSEIREGRNSFKPIVPYSQHDAVYYGLAKIANDTDRRYSAEDATAIRAMIGSPSTADIPTRVSDLVNDSGYYTKPSTGIPASDGRAVMSQCYRHEVVEPEPEPTPEVEPEEEPEVTPEEETPAE